MRSPQEKFFAVLKQRVEEAGLELVVERSFSNVGILHIQETDSFNTRLSLPWQFNSGSPTYFGWMAHREKHPAVFPQHSNSRWAGFGPDELGTAVDEILEYCCIPAYGKAQAS